MQVSRFAFRLLPIVVLTSAAAWFSLTKQASAQPAGPGATSTASALPAAASTGSVTQIVVSGGARALFKIAVTAPPGDATAVARRRRRLLVTLTKVTVGRALAAALHLPVLSCTRTHRLSSAPKTMPVRMVLKTAV